MKFYFFTFLTTLLVFSCENSKTSESDYAYFGGEIINPSNNYVTISNSNDGRDTIYLDKSNRFLHKIDNLTPGIYTFTHGGEFQTILLESSDSLLIRLNTNDFDESLVYTGSGSKKNNYLIKSFLNDEIENKRFRKTSHLEPEVFVDHMKELRKEKLAHFEEFLSKKPSSELFETIVKSSIDYNYYAYHEMFPFGYYGNNKLIHFKDLPDDFYDFRNEVNFNNEDLSKLYAYNRFLFWHFNNIALKQYYIEGNHNAFDKMAFDYNTEKLKLIDSSITNEKIKNYLLKHNIRDFVLNTNDPDATDNLINYYLERSTNADDKRYISTLAQSVNRLKSGQVLPDTDVIDYNGNTLNLSSLITKPTVIYCWSTVYKMHSRNSHFKINRLQKRFPDINFVAINFNDSDMQYWKKTVRSLNYPSKNEYKFSNPEKASDQYVITLSHKVFVVDENMEIVNSNIELFNDELIECLERLSTSSKSSSIK